MVGVGHPRAIAWWIAISICSGPVPVSVAAKMVRVADVIVITPSSGFVVSSIGSQN
jgi:hypothetical protein